MTSILTDSDLESAFKAIAHAQGEAVWDRHIIVGERRYALPLMWTTWLANHLGRGSLVEGDPKKWVVERTSEDAWRLYLRVGERYGEGWAHHFVAPVEVAIKSSREYVLLSQLPKDQWWQAEFVCPFCGSLCTGHAKCSHLFIVHHSVTEPYRTPALVALMDAMRERDFNCNLLNASIDGLKIKVPRVFTNAEWFRFAYWYVSDTRVVDQVEQTWLKGRDS